MKFWVYFLSHFIFFITVLVIPVFSRPLGEGFEGSREISFDQNWNQDLEKKEKHPWSGFSDPYWHSRVKEMQKGLVSYDRSLIRELRMVENSVELSFYTVDTTGMDRPLAWTGTNRLGSETAFDSRGFAYEIRGRFPVYHYNLFLSWFQFSPSDGVKMEQNPNGYSLSFGDRVSELEGKMETTLDLISLGKETFLDQGDFHRFSFLSGISYLKMDRYERLRGVDRLGLNQKVSAIDNSAIVLEQGEDQWDLSGTGAFLGFNYHSQLNEGLSYFARSNAHYLSGDSKQRFLSWENSANGALKKTDRQNVTDSGSILLDLEFRVQKYLRHFYNLSLGVRWMEVLHEERKTLSGDVADKFSIKGLQFSVQRFF